jgi:hypothetical protein
MQGATHIADSHPHRITSTKRRINTVVSPDEGPILARNMSRLININILRINCAPSWLYLQDYTEMHGQQNVKLRHYLSEISSVFLFVLLEGHSGPLTAINMEVKMSTYTDNCK